MQKYFATFADMKSYYLFLADGFEISEALTTADMLRRGGIPVQTVSIKDNDRTVTSSNRTTVIADMEWNGFSVAAKKEREDCSGLMVFPGGMPGSVNLAAKEELMTLMTEHFVGGGVTAAICAAPSVVLHRLPGLSARFMCCYEGFEKALEDAGAYVRKDCGVVSDGNLVTARGAGYATEFGLAVVAALRGQEAADKVAAEIMLPVRK